MRGVDLAEEILQGAFKHILLREVENAVIGIVEIQRLTQPLFFLGRILVVEVVMINGWANLTHIRRLCLRPLYLGGATLFGYKPDLISWALAALASLLPDIDLPPSKIGRLFWFVSVPLERRFGHRTLTHSAVMVLAVAVLSWPLTLIQPLYWGCVVGGYWSHLWIDMLNIRGVDLFWPSPMRLVRPATAIGGWRSGARRK
jgi:hypothetical protein